MDSEFILRLPTEDEMVAVQDEATATDFALLSGVTDHQYLINNKGGLWSNKYRISNNGVGIRPVMENPILYLVFPEIMNGYFERGGYPQWAASKALNQDLTMLHAHGALAVAKKESLLFSSHNEFTEYVEYVFNGKKYVRIPAQQRIRLSNGDLVEKGDYYFVEITPITWYYLEDRNLAITKHIIGPSADVLRIPKYVDTINKHLKELITFSNLYVPFYPTEAETLNKFKYIEERLKLMRINNPDLENEILPLIEGIAFLEAAYQKDKTGEIERLQQSLDRAQDLKTNFIPFIQRKLTSYIATLENSGQFLTKSKKSALANDMEETKTLIKTYIKGKRNRSLLDAMNE